MATRLCIVYKSPCLLACLNLYPIFCTPAMSFLFQVPTYILCCKAFASQIHFLWKNLSSAPLPALGRLSLLKNSNTNYIYFLWFTYIPYMCTYLNVFLLYENRRRDCFCFVLFCVVYCAPSANPVLAQVGIFGYMLQ